MVAFNVSSLDFTAAGATAADRAPVAAGQLEARHDATLVRRFQLGDEAAFTEIVSRYRGKASAIAFARLGNHADAEEIAQDTFVRAHRALAAFRGESSLSTWLHRITVNLSLNRYWYFFRRGRHVTQSLDRALRVDGAATLADVVASGAPSPIGDAMLAELTQLVAACMARLAPDQREILVLRNTQEQQYGEIARTLGIKVGTVKSRIARARQSLRALMHQASPESSGAGEPLDAWESLRLNGRAGSAIG